MGDSLKRLWINVRHAVVTVCVLAAVFGFGTTVQAHKVNLFAYVEGDEIIVEGYFSGSAKAMNCIVDVLDNTGKKLLEGKTDARGLCSFKVAEVPPVTGDLKFIIHAGQGHMADFTLPAADLPASIRGGSSASGAAVKPPTVPVQSEKAETNTPVRTAEVLPPAGMDTGALKKVLDETLDARIQPLVKMLGNQQKMLLEQKDKGPSVVEILGGIGWIFGIFGTAAYFSRAKRSGQAVNSERKS